MFRKHRPTHSLPGIKILMLVCALESFQAWLFAQPIQIAANNSFMPFSYPDDNGKPAGISVIFVKDLLDKAKIAGQVELFPLQRALAMAENPNTLCFAIFRTAEREKKYKWVVPVTWPIHSVLIKLKTRSDIRIKNLSDAANYSIGVVDGNNLQTLLKSSGFNSQLQAVATNEQNYRKLSIGRIDLMAVRDSSLTTELITSGLSPDDIMVAYQLSDDGPAWLIASLRTSDAVIARIQRVYEQAKKDGLLKKISDHFLAQFK